MYDYTTYDATPYPEHATLLNQHGTGDTRFAKYDRFQFKMCQIAQAPNFVIDRKGSVFDFDTGERIQPEDSRYIILNNTKFDIDILLLYGFVGELPLPIVDRSEPPVTAIYRGRRCSKLTYFIKKVTRDQTDPDIAYLDKVRFKRIPFARDPWFISENGVIYDFKNDDFIMREFNFGYPQVIMPVDRDKFYDFFTYRRGNPDIPVTWRVHSLVYCTYKGVIPEGLQVDHIDNTRYNQHVDNLQLLTPLENTRKSRESGHRKTGFTYELNETIAKMLSEKKTNQEIAKAIGFAYETRKDKHRLANIINKLRTQPGYFDDLKEKYNLSDYDPNNSYPFTKLTPELREQIRAESAAGVKGCVLAEKYNVTPATISRVINEK